MAELVKCVIIRKYCRRRNWNIKFAPKDKIKEENVLESSMKENFNPLMTFHLFNFYLYNCLLFKHDLIHITVGLNKTTNFTEHVKFENKISKSHFSNFLMILMI